MWMSLDLYQGNADTGLGNVLVPSGNKPLLEPMLTPLHVAMLWPQWKKKKEKQRQKMVNVLQPIFEGIFLDENIMLINFT